MESESHHHDEPPKGKMVLKPLLRPPPPPPGTQASISTFRSYSQSKEPILLLTALFGISSLFPRPYFPQNVYIPPYLARSGFGVLFGYATYMFACGDSRNGSGFATSTTLMYLFMNFTKSIKAPRHPLSLALTGGAAACAALYGTEYFYFQDRLV